MFGNNMSEMVWIMSVKTCVDMKCKQEAGMRAWFACETWCVGNHTDRARGLAFFSTTSGEQWKGMQGLRDCVAEKGPIPCAGCVWVS